MRNIPDQVRDFRKRWSRRRSKGEMVNKERDLYKAGTPQDVSSIRAKNSGHRKVAADKWNQ